MVNITVVDQDLKFKKVPIKDLREDYIYSLIQLGKITPEQFSTWVENERDTWFAHGQNIQKSS